MNEDTAWLIVRLADAVGEEGIWHRVDRPGTDGADNRVLSEAVQVAWDRMDERLRDELGPRPGGQ